MSDTDVADHTRYSAVLRWRTGEAFVTATVEFEVFDEDVSLDVHSAAGSIVEFSADPVNNRAFPILSFGFVGSDHVLASRRSRHTIRCGPGVVNHSAVGNHPSTRRAAVFHARHSRVR